MRWGVDTPELYGCVLTFHMINSEGFAAGQVSGLRGTLLYSADGNILLSTSIALYGNIVVRTRSEESQIFLKYVYHDDNVENINIGGIDW